MEYDLRPQTLNLDVKQGDSLKLGEFTLRLPDGSPLDLTGCLIAAQMRRGSRAYSFTVTRGVDAAGTIASIERLLDMTPGPWDWDLQITDTLGKPRTYLAGVIRVEEDATRAP